MRSSLDVDHISSLVVIAGLSGAGKSSAMDLLGDSGYYIVDNLPVPLVEQFLAYTKKAGTRFRNTALLLDIDSQESRAQLLPMLGTASERPKNLKVIFLDANTQTIVKRYSETRRPHPGFDAGQDKTLSDTIARERQRLQPIKETADLLLDTSAFTIHALRRELREFLTNLGSIPKGNMRVNFFSFGFKHGVPLDCDLIVDVRFLRNPHFIEELRQQDGRDSPVRDYVLECPDAQEFVSRYENLLRFLLPKYQYEGKAYLNVGIGCTGGQHRSVAIAEELCKRLKGADYLVSVKHREL